MKSASKIGSSTSFNAAWTTRSAMVGMPNAQLSRTSAFRDQSLTHRQRTKRAVLDLCPQIVQEPLNTDRHLDGGAVQPSTPGVSRPRVAATRANAILSVAGSCTKL